MPTSSGAILNLDLSIFAGCGVCSASWDSAGDNTSDDPVSVLTSSIPSPRLMAAIPITTDTASTIAVFVFTRDGHPRSTKSFRNPKLAIDASWFVNTSAPSIIMNPPSKIL